MEINKTAHPANISVMGVTGIAIYDNMLAAFTINPAALMSIVDLDTEKVLLEKGTRGRGPGEFLSFVTSKQFVVQNGHICLWAYDNQAKKSVLIDITKSIENQTIVIIETWQLGVEYLQNGGILVLPSGERFVKFPITYKDTRDNHYQYPKYLYFSSDDEEVGELAFFKRGTFSLSASEFENVRMLMFDGFLSQKPDGTKAIDVFHHSDHLNFLDLINNRGFSVHYSEGMSVDDLASASTSLSYLLRHYVKVYRDATVTDDYVLALYSGKSEALEGNIAPCTKSAVRIFDWEGNPLILVHVDRELGSIAYDQRTKRLYALDPEENIVYYELDDVL
ncbi:MAG: TolB-like 6-bladed beta-propeller domain-containing protein [Tannerella sp.]|jgi:hypothetical protein|nr:TolB-like 6-bladed beta-propeller domain-containing protein [Tannerella sp.]